MVGKDGPVLGGDVEEREARHIYALVDQRVCIASVRGLHVAFHPRSPRQQELGPHLALFEHP